MFAERLLCTWCFAAAFVGLELRRSTRLKASTENWMERFLACSAGMFGFQVDLHGAKCRNTWRGSCKFAVSARHRSFPQIFLQTYPTLTPLELPRRGLFLGENQFLVQTIFLTSISTCLQRTYLHLCSIWTPLHSKPPRRNLGECLWQAFCSSGLWFESQLFESHCDLLAQLALRALLRNPYCNQQLHTIPFEFQGTHRAPVLVTCKTLGTHKGFTSLRNSTLSFPLHDV